MVELRRVWRGLKRMILSGGKADATIGPSTGGEATVLAGRAAIDVVGERLRARGSGSRDELAAAVGLAVSGIRATTWLTRLDPSLTVAVSQRLPLVAHVALEDGSSHAVYHAAVQAGWVALHPHNLQEAVDLTLTAHRLAGDALTPVLVAVSAEEIVNAVQDVSLPDGQLCETVAGRPTDTIKTPTAAQRLLFGAERRRMPQFFDLDRPTMHGVRGSGLAAASGRAFFRRHVPDLLTQALRHTAATTGRALTPLYVSNIDHPHCVLVAQGAVVELAEAVATELAHEKLSIRVIGLRCPTETTRAELEPWLADSDATIVLRPGATLESPDTTFASLLPNPTATAFCGFPEHPLRAADLLALCRDVHDGRRGDACLGLTFLPSSRSYPKREILLQQLRRDYGELEQLGLRSEETVDLRGSAATTISVNRTASAGGEELAPGIASLLSAVPGSSVRSRCERRSRGYGVTSVDSFTLGRAGMKDPGADLPTDVLLLLHGSIHPSITLAEASAVIVPLTGDDEVDSLPLVTLAALAERRADLFVIRTDQRTAPHESPLPEAVLGAICGVLQARGVDLNTRRAVQVRDEALADLPRAEYAARVGDFARGIEAVERVHWKDVTMPRSDTSAGAHADSPTVPLSVRNLQGAAGKHDGGTFESVPRFWDQVGVLYRHGLEQELSPDPFQATGSLPPLTATFHDLSTTRRTIRVFAPEFCTGCGECWTICPDCALGPAALRFEDVLTAGMSAAKDSGRSADALRPMIGKIAARAKKLATNENDANAATTVGPTLREAFDYVLEKAAPAADRRQSLRDAFDLVLTHVDEFPVAKAKPFFDNGELLTVAVHVEACKACGACTEVCETGAILGETQTPDLVAAARKNWQVFERLPDTRDETIARVADDESVGRAAALLLDRHSMFTLSGGDTAEPGSGEKIAVHLALAAAEQRLQPRLQRHVAEVDELERRFTEKIRELMAGSLPTEDLEGLSRSLDELGGRHVDLSALAAKAEASGDRTPLDATWLRALANSARELRDLRERLSKGKSGLGRARVGLLVAPGNVETWAAAFPYNPFPVPVVLDQAGATAELARGLCLGQIETVLDDFRLLRRARLELERPVEAQRAAAELANLTWQDLTPEEREVCPPLLLCGGDDSLGSRGLTELATVLSSDLPIKLLVLAGLDFGLQDASGLGRGFEGADIPHGDTGMLALAHRRAYVVQSSIGDPDHFVRGCLGAFDHDGPALVHVHAPSPQRHGFATHLTREQGLRALEAGALPRFTYDPHAVGLFGLRLELQDAPRDDQTLAHFAVTEGRFAHHFTPLPSGAGPVATDDAPEPTELVAHLALEPRQRAGKTPFLLHEGQRLQVSDAMVAACDDRRHSMQVLQELAGIVTPFTERVETDVSARVAGEHSQDLDVLRKEYEAKLAAMRGELQQEFTSRLRDRLVELAERHRRSTGATP